MAVDIDIVYEGTLACRATHRPSAAELVTDAPTDNGGRGASFSPTDLVATALGTCVITTMALVAERNSLDLRGTQVHVRKEMVTSPTRRIGALPVTVTVPAERAAALPAADRDKLERAAHLCPVHQSLHPDVHAPIDFIYL